MTTQTNIAAAAVPQVRPARKAMWAGVALAAIGIIMAAGNILAAVQIANDQQPWYSRALGHEPTLTETAAKGMTTDPYALGVYPLEYPRGQGTHEMLIRTRPQNAVGVLELITRDAIHTHGRVGIPGELSPEGQTDLWIHYGTLRLMRELNTIPIDDQAAINEWAAAVEQEPWDIDLMATRYQYGPSWRIVMKIETEPQGPSARDVARWGLLALMAAFLAAGAALILRHGRAR